jgi:hypothetical protein
VQFRFEQAEGKDEVHLPKAEYSNHRMSTFTKILLTPFTRTVYHDCDMLFLTVLKYSEERLVIVDMIEVLKEKFKNLPINLNQRIAFEFEVEYEVKGQNQIDQKEESKD